MKTETCISDPSQFRKDVSVKEIDFSMLHFFDVEQNTFNKEDIDFNKGWLGIFMEDEKGKGVLVKQSVKGSPADTYGLRSGDIITHINGAEVKSKDNSNLVLFKKLVEESGKGSTVDLTVLRSNEELHLKPKLIPKLLDKTTGFEKTDKENDKEGYSNFYIDKLKERKFNMDKSFYKLALNDDEFKEKCQKTLQRIGEEVFVREGYQFADKTNVFRLPLIDYLLERPFDIPYAAEIIHNQFVDVPVSHAFNSACSLLNANTVERINEPDLDDTNAALQEALENIFNNAFECKNRQKTALKILTEDEFKFLFEKSPKIWINSEEVDENVLAEFLEISKKVDIQALMESLSLAVTSIPVNYLKDIKPEQVKLQQFKLPESKSTQSAATELSPVKIENRNTKGFIGDIMFIQETDIGKIVVGGTDTTYYYDDAAFIIDLGGNDYYFNNAGSSRPDSPVSICFDFSGDDTYVAQTNFTQGSGLFGAGILMDFNGDDSYLGREYSQGVGVFGIGLIYDENGDDLYNSHAMCQGGASFGIGLLYDMKGNDQYFSRWYSQGLGLTKGVGGLIDSAGNDTYVAGSKYPDFRDPEKAFQSFSQGFALGIRPVGTIVGASGGIGLLIDETGNDSYHGDYFAQGCSYYFSLGMLYDKNGHDKYFAGRYSQGAGIHSALGILRDDSGDDSYNASFGVSQACGYDTGIGYLVDLKGNDYYKSNVMSQGVGGEKGLGVLADFNGNDYHYAGGDSLGYSYPSENETFFGISILSDVGGNTDVFNFDVPNDSLVYRGNAGILMNKGD